MGQKSRDKVTMLFVKSGGRIAPATSFDAELFDERADGSEFDVKPRSKRSNPQLKLYWATLADVLRRVGTDTWPTPEHLSDALKQACGYITTYYRLDGTPYLATDSIGFDAMTQAEFQGYFDAAMKKLSETVGYDVLDGYEEWAREHRHGP